MHPARIFEKIALGFPILVILLVGLLVIVRTSTPRPPILNAQPFDHQTWLAHPESKEPPPIRQRMVDDLLQKRDFSHSTQKEVETLLGPGTTTDKFPKWDLVYWLGPERGSLPIDSEWLVFKFNIQGTVEKHKLLTD